MRAAGGVFLPQTKLVPHAMFTHLSIRDFAVVEELELELAGGMNVVTGETGAGKSILLDALGLTLGNRSDADFVAPGAARAEVIAGFEVQGGTARAWLAERELGQADTAEVLLRRTIGRDGRSRAFINGIPTTVSELRELGNLLIDIHAQHEHQSLLKLDTHRRLLDEFGAATDLAEEATALAAEHQQAAARRKALLNAAEEQSAERQLLSYQAEELETLDLHPEELTSLEADQAELASAESLISAGQSVTTALAAGDPSVVDLLQRATAELSALGQPRLQGVIDLLESGRIQIDEAAGDLGRYLDAIDVNPARLREVETRLDALYSVARKHRVQADELPALHKDIARRLARLGSLEQELGGIDDNLTAIAKHYARAADKLSKARKRAAKRLEKEVMRLLAELGMPATRLEVALTPRDADTPHAGGQEAVEFLIATHTGHPPRPLGRIASGGELSRISLAIQVATSETSYIPTLVFDEVDVGIGGGTAEKVGRLMRELGKKAQIICVTHLPQVAAHGHTQYQVSREADTTIRRLSEKERTAEIARMLGGKETARSAAHAREILTTAKGK